MVAPDYHQYNSLLPHIASDKELLYWLQVRNDAYRGNDGSVHVHGPPSEFDQHNPIIANKAQTDNNHADPGITEHIKRKDGFQQDTFICGCVIEQNKHGVVFRYSCSTQDCLLEDATE